MNVERTWLIDTNDFVREVEAIDHARPLLLDDHVRTWQLSYFRFAVGSPAEYRGIPAFVAMVAFRTNDIRLPIVEWARGVHFFVLSPERALQALGGARDDAKAVGISAPKWLRIEGDIIDAFELDQRGGTLWEGLGPTSITVYRTTTAYYYLEVHHES